MKKEGTQKGTKDKKGTVSDAKVFNKHSSASGLSWTTTAASGDKLYNNTCTYFKASSYVYSIG